VFIFGIFQQKKGLFSLSLVKKNVCPFHNPAFCHGFVTLLYLHEEAPAGNNLLLFPVAGQAPG